MRILILFFAVGTALCQLLGELPSWHMLALIVLPFLFAARWSASRHPLAARSLLCAATLLLGLGLAVWRAEVRLGERLPSTLEKQDILLQGRIVDLPQRNARGLKFLFEPEASASNPGVQGRISLSWYADSRTLPALHSGQRWQMTVRLRQPHGNFNPPVFDQEAWLFERGITALGYVRKAGARPLPEVQGLPLMARLDRWRENIRSRFERALPDSPWRGVLVALVVGDQAAIPEAQWALFRVTGTTHLMSISGLHVTLIAVIIGGLTGALWRRVPSLMLRWPAQKAALPAGVLAAGFYVLIAGAGVPAVRTFCMLLVAALALLSGRESSPSRIMAAALLCVLVLDPWAVLSAGFWLSFSAVGALLMLDAGRRQKAISGGPVPGWMMAWLRSQWAVTLMALPLLLGLFQQFSLVSPLANALAIPVVSALVTPLAMLFALLPLPLPVLASLASWMTGCLMKFLMLLAGLPQAVWMQAAPPGWLVGCCLLAAILALLPRGMPGRWAGVLAFVPLLGFTPARPQPGSMLVNVLDVGQGLAVHVQTHQHDLLFDAGPQYGLESDAGSRIIVPWLRSQGVTHVDDFVISHADRDHAGGATSLLENLIVARLRSSLAADDPILRRSLPHLPCEAGKAWRTDGVSFRFLHPSVDFPGSENDRSCVLAIASEGGRLLLTGDIGLRAESRLTAEDSGTLAADVLIAPHHGSRTSSSPAFVEAVAARHVVFTPGYLSRFGHPAPDVVARYEATGADLYRTDRDGLVRFRFDPDGIHAERLRNIHQRYWHDRD